MPPYPSIALLSSHHFFQRREEVPCPPSTQPLEEITAFPGRDAPVPKQIRGLVTFPSAGTRCCGSPCSDLRRAAKPQAGTWGWRDEAGGRQGPDHAGEGPASGSRQAPPHSHPSLSHSNSPTGRLRWLPAGTAAQHAQCFCFFTLPRSKVPEPLHRRSGLEQRAQSRPGSRTALPAHPTCPKTSPGVTAGDSWELPRVSLAWAQLVPPITCELYGGAEGGRFQS